MKNTKKKILLPTPVYSIPKLPPIVTHVYTANYSLDDELMKMPHDVQDFFTGEGPVLPKALQMFNTYYAPTEECVYFKNIPPLHIPDIRNEPFIDKVSQYIGSIYLLCNTR